jgi:MFS family permease
MKDTSAFSIAVLAACGLAVVAQLYLPVPLLEPLAAQYGVPVTAAGLVLTVFGVAYATGFLVFGPLSDRVGRKKVMVPGLLALAGASVLVALVPTFEAIVGVRIVQGFVAAALPPVALAYLAEALPEQRRALGIAAMSTAFLLAGLLGQLYGSVVGSLTAAVLPLAGVYVVGALLVWLLPEQRTAQAQPSDSLFRTYRGLPALLMHRVLRRAYTAALVLLFAFVAFYTALDLFIADRLTQAGLDLTTVRAAAVPAMLLPLIAARFIRAHGPRAVVCTGFAVGAAGLIAAAAVALSGAPVWLLIVASMVFVAGVSISVPSLIALISGLASVQRGLAIALYTFVLFVGASLGPQFPPLVAPLGFGGLCLILGGLFAAAAALNAAPHRAAAPQPEYAAR